MEYSNFVSRYAGVHVHRRYRITYHRAGTVQRYLSCYLTLLKLFNYGKLRLGDFTFYYFLLLFTLRLPAFGTGE